MDLQMTTYSPDRGYSIFFCFRSMSIFFPPFLDSDSNNDDMLSGNSKAFILIFRSLSFIFSSSLGFPTSKADSLTSQGQTAGSRRGYAQFRDPPSYSSHGTPALGGIHPSLSFQPPPSGKSFRRGVFELNFEMFCTQTDFRMVFGSKVFLCDGCFFWTETETHPCAHPQMWKYSRRKFNGGVGG